MTGPAPGATAPPSRLRRVTLDGILVIAVVIAGVVTATSLFPARASSPSLAVGWRLADGFLGTPVFDPTTAQSTTVIPISVDWLECAPKNDSWLAPPQIAYTPSSVTITMRTSDNFGAVTTCGAIVTGKEAFGIILDVGIPVEVHLAEPLRGRALFDGGWSSPVPRPYR